MESEISVKLTFNDDMRRFSFRGASFNALREYVIALLGLDNQINLKYVDEDGDLITLSSDSELKAAIAPGKVLRLSVSRVGAPAAGVPVAQPSFVSPSAPEPMEVSISLQPFAHGGAPMHRHPPGFQGPPHAPFHGPHHGHPHHAPHGPHHGHPHHGPGHHGPFACDKSDKKLAKQEWIKFKEDRKKAKKELSREEYAAFKLKHKQIKETHKQAKAAHKQAKEAHKLVKREFKKEHKKGGKWGRRGHHGFPHHGPPHGFPPHGFPHHGPHHGGPHHGMPHHMPPFAHHDMPVPFGGPGLYPQLGGRFGCQQESKFIARHVKDVTIEDGTQLPAGTAFVKTWRVRNEGPAWPAGCQLHFLSKRCGDSMSGPDFITIEGAVETNQEVDISANLVAPNKPGRYIGFWRLCTPNGRKFGQRMWVSIVVPSLGNSSSSSDEEERLADRYELLVDAVLAQGFAVKRHRVFRLLEKCNGDVQKVANILADKVQRKEAKAARQIQNCM